MNHSSDQADIDGVAIAVAESCVVCTRAEIEQLMPVVKQIQGSSNLSIDPSRSLHVSVDH